MRVKFIGKWECSSVVRVSWTIIFANMRVVIWILVVLFALNCFFLPCKGLEILEIRASIVNFYRIKTTLNILYVYDAAIDIFFFIHQKKIKNLYLCVMLILFFTALLLASAFFSTIQLNDIQIYKGLSH